MKKLFIFMLCCFAGLFFVSCGGSESGEACESNFDCPVGKVCSSAGKCVSENSAEDGSQDGDSEFPDGENGFQDGSSSHDGEASADDSESTLADDPFASDCTPGKTRKCEYQGPDGSENVGPCKAAISTCQDDGTWGNCEGEVLPVYEAGQELCTNGIDDDCDGVVDNGTVEGACAYWQDPTDPTDPTENPDSDSVIDVGYTGNYSEAYLVPDDAEMCTDTCVPVKAECFPTDIDEGAAGLCNQVDDDCDGKVDEGCSCSAGQTQPCFLGPKNFRGVGGCHDGVQTCKVTMRALKSVGQWGDCVGGIGPKPDVCDNLDNNCNGCTDDKLCCAPPIDCAFDIGTAKPFTDKIINGKLIYDSGHKFNDADTATWEWTLTKGPCDIVLGTTSFKTKGATTEAGLSGEGTASATVSGVGLSQFKVNFILSGSYILKLKVTRPNGEVYECEWVLRVVSKGLRIELCWDTTGTVDVDLHLAKVGTSSGWDSSGKACYYGNCKNTGTPDWGYPTTTNAILNQTTLEFEQNKTAYNPRLDIDNISKVGVPENINIDNPNNGDTFRIGVNYYSSKTVLTHPVVNVYCGGTLKSTFGVTPQVANFNGKSKLWKAAEVQWVGDSTSDECVITPKFNEASASYILGTVGTYDW